MNNLSTLDTSTTPAVSAVAVTATTPTVQPQDSAATSPPDISTNVVVINGIPTPLPGRSGQTGG